MSLEIEINGTCYELATTLRVAYKIQGQHNHKPYSKVFEGVSDMKLEEQVGILYAAFQVANPNVEISRPVFFESVLDKYGLASIMQLIGDIIKGIMFRGMSEEAINRYEDEMGKLKMPDQY